VAKELNNPDVQKYADGSVVAWREQGSTPDALDALRGLARNYDMKGIRAYLRPGHAARSGGHLSRAGA
jgi:hypothetical protein